MDWPFTVTVPMLITPRKLGLTVAELVICTLPSALVLMIGLLAVAPMKPPQLPSGLWIVSKFDQNRLIASVVLGVVPAGVVPMILAATSTPASRPTCRRDLTSQTCAKSVAPPIMAISGWRSGRP